MVHNFLGNPHKTEYEDIDEDFNMLAEEFVDDQDSLDYDDNDYYEEEEEHENGDDYYEEEEDENDDDNDDDYFVEYDSEYPRELDFLSDSDSILDIDVPGPPNGGVVENINTDPQKSETIASVEKESTDSKADTVSEIISTVHRNIENNSET